LNNPRLQGFKMGVVTLKLKALDMHLEGDKLIKFLAARGVYVKDIKGVVMYRCKNDKITQQEAIQFCKDNKIEFSTSK